MALHGLLALCGSMGGLIGGALDSKPPLLVQLAHIAAQRHAPQLHSPALLLLAMLVRGRTAACEAALPRPA